jgi:hypothetical protein
MFTLVMESEPTADEDYEDEDALDDDPFEDVPEPKPSPMKFADGFSPAKAKPVTLQTPSHSNAFAVLSRVARKRLGFP